MPRTRRKVAWVFRISPSQGRSYYAHERRHRNGLFEHRERSQLASVRPEFRGHKPAAEDERQTRQSAVQDGEQLQTLDIGEDLVGQHSGVRAVLQRAQRVGAARRSFYLESGLSEHRAEQVKGDGVVLDDEHASGAIHLLLNDLIRPRQHRRRDREAEGLRGLQVDHELELRGLLDG
jgi:hypothetical protein